MPIPKAQLAMEDAELWPENELAWAAWHQIAPGRQVGLGGLSGLALSEISAWFQLAGQPTDWELVGKIRMIDGEFLRVNTPKDGQPDDDNP